MRPLTAAVCALVLGATCVLPAQKPAARFDLAPTWSYLKARTDVRAKAPTVGLAAWTMRAYLADGSTMRSGTHKSELKQLTRWLREQQDERGWFAPGSKPCARFDQLVATHAMTLTWALSNYTLLKPTAAKAANAVERAMTEPGAPPATADEFAVLALIAEDMRYFNFNHAAADRYRALAAAARANLQFGADRRTDAALHLADLWLGKKHPAELTVARTWPANSMADPLHTFYGTLALRFTDERTFESETERLGKLISVRAPAGSDAGSWPAVAGLDQVTATAVLATAIASAGKWR